jgi:putative ABC transport system permease protein
MSWLEALRLALEQIRAQKLKSFFTLLGVTIGVMFLIAVVSVVEGMGSYMEHDLVGKILAVHSFELRRFPDINLGDVDDGMWLDYVHRPRITEEDLHPVVDALPPGTRWYMLSEDRLTIESPYARPRQVGVFAVTGDYFTIKSLGVVNGRTFTDQELESGGLVAVIGQDTKTHFFPTVDPIGRWVRMGGIPYTVVGVAEKQGSIFGQSLDAFVVAPYRAPVHRLLNRERGVVDAIVVQSVDDQVMTDAQERVRQVMRTRRHLRPTQPDNFSEQTPASALKFWESIQRYMVFAAIVLPAIGLVVGAIVIMNIMLVAVAERTREIGIRKSLGARRQDILAQFLIEAATLSTVGAAVGIALGLVVAQLVTHFTPMPVAVAPWSIGMALVLGAGVGIVSGVYPASRAARLDPIDALRQE